VEASVTTDWLTAVSAIFAATGTSAAAVAAIAAQVRALTASWQS
jgi:hypothetical protein